ncbi:hypothetical protein NC652_007644 [Populus alba x Populus x berolinensis]|nr:hypothetical protein NC652_007644 [Populus alba x Populus x berolinensis]
MTAPSSTFEIEGSIEEEGLYLPSQKGRPVENTDIKNNGQRHWKLWEEDEQNRSAQRAMWLRNIILDRAGVFPV